MSTLFRHGQTPDGAYAAVIPLWVKQLINHESPVINGDGSYSRDFTYIENVMQANEKALFTSNEDIGKGQYDYYNLELESHKNFDKNPGAQSEDICVLSKVEANFSEIFNIAFGRNTTLIQLFESLKSNLAKYDPEILKVNPIFGSIMAGDVPHSHASILKAKTVLGYDPKYNATQGFENVCGWYFNELK